MELMKYKLGDLICQRREKNDGGNYKIVGVSREGFIKPKQIEADTSIYNMFYKKDFVFNPARMELNSIVFNDVYEKAICSSLYEMFYVVREDIVLPEYLAFIIKTDWFTRYCDFLGNGSAREYCRVANLSEMEIPLPCIDEQKNIVNLCLTLKNRKETLKNEIDSLNSLIRLYFDKVISSLIESKHTPENRFNDLVVELISGDWGTDVLQGNNSEHALCIRGADLESVNLGTIKSIPNRFLLKKNIELKKLENANLVVEMSGGSPTQSTGRIAIINDTILSQTNLPLISCNFCKGIKVKKDCEYFFITYWKYLYDKNVMFKYENSTTGLKNFRLEEFLSDEPIYIPNDLELRKINSNLIKMYNRKSILGYEIALLDETYKLIKNNLV